MTAEEYAREFGYLTAPERSMKYLSRADQGKVYAHVYGAVELALLAGERTTQPRAYVENAARRLHAATGIRLTLESIGGLIRERRIRAVMVKRTEVAARAEPPTAPPTADRGAPFELVCELATRVENLRQDLAHDFLALRSEFADKIAALNARLDKVEDGHDLFVDQNASLRGALDKVRGLGAEFERFDRTSDKIARSRIRPLPTPDHTPATPDPGT